MKCPKSVIVAAVGAAMSVSATVQAAEVVIGVPNWPSVLATAHVLKVALEDNLGLAVELQNGTNPVVFEAMDSGAKAYGYAETMKLKEMDESLALAEVDKPEAAKMIAQVALDTNTVSAMTFALVVEKQDPAEFAKIWVSENTDTVDGWLK